MSDEDPLVNGEKLSSLRVVDLKSELEKRGLSKIGNKSILAERLRESIISGGGTPACTPVKDVTKSPVVENPMVAEYRAKQRALLEGKSPSARSPSTDASSPASSPKKSQSSVESPKKTDVISKETEINTKEDSQEEKIIIEDDPISEENAPLHDKEKSPTGVESETEDSDVKESDVNESDVKESDVKESDVKESDVKESDVKESDVKESDVRESDVKESDVKESDVKESDVKESDVKESDIKEASDGDSNPDPVVEAGVDSPQNSPVERIENVEDNSPSVNENSNVEPEDTIEDRQEASSEDTSSPPSRQSGSLCENSSSPVATSDDKPNQQDSKDEVKDEQTAGVQKNDSAEDMKEEETQERAESKNDFQEEGVEELELDYGDNEDSVDDEREKDDGNTLGASTKKEIVAPQIESVESSSKLPSRHPVSAVLHIRGLVRPFTDRQLKSEISQYGEVTDFWIDKIKSHCFIKMANNEQATAVREAMHDITWPQSSPKQLSVQFDTVENLEKHKAGNADDGPSGVSRSLSSDKERERHVIGSLPGRNGSLRGTVEAVMRDNQKRDIEMKERQGRERDVRSKEDEKKRTERRDEDRENDRKRRYSGGSPRRDGVVDKKLSRSEKEDVPVKTADSLFMKTKTEPKIYYMPLTEEEAKIRKQKREEERQRRDSDRDRRRR